MVLFHDNHVAIPFLWIIFYPQFFCVQKPGDPNNNKKKKNNVAEPFALVLEGIPGRHHIT